MVQQTQEQKGGVSFGQVAGAALAGTGTLLGTRAGLRNMNANSRLVAENLAEGADLSKMPEKAAESINAFKKLSGEIRDKVKQVQDVLGETTKNAVDTTKDVADSTKDVADSAKDIAKDKAVDILKETKNNVKELVNLSKENAQNFANKLNEKSQPLMENAEGAIKETAETVQSSMKDMSKKLNESLKGVGTMSKGQALAVGLATVAAVGLTAMALKPKPKVTEAQHQGMAQGRPAQPQLA